MPTDHPTVVLIPGLISDRFVWKAAISALEPLPVEVADVSRQPTITAMANDMLTRYPGRLLLIGHSMGGRVAMEAARIAPARIAGMALLDTGIHPVRDGEEAKRQAKIDLANENGMPALAEAWLPGMVNAERPPDRELMSQLTAMCCRTTAEVHERQMRALLSRPDASATLADFDGPMLLIVGRQDRWSPIAQHQDIARLCPQAQLEIIENAGHFAPVEQPEAVAEILAHWAQQHIPADDGPATPLR